MITTEILAAYLPYKFNIEIDGVKKELIGLESPYKTNNNFFINAVIRDPNGTYRNTQSLCLSERNANLCKPILRPLSELRGNHHHLGLLDMDYAKLANYLYDANFSLPLLDVISYNAARELLKQHYNVFNLPDGEYVKKV